MDYYVCDRCEHGFDRANTGSRRECMTDDPCPMYQKFITCPECGCDDLKEGFQCDCGDIIPEEDVTTCKNCGDKFCANCAVEFKGFCCEDCYNEYNYSFSRQLAMAEVAS